ncbi:hypothetical protein OU798_08780 [Prolixibacteraceae bacterium Z1-6]|uniref:Uncharacterized protein n=1 Tax=Draconibacterium aestuarii TaxID=2998507 RepID=A0A9X3J5Z4_9BACT|nr:hypothetical protein [Prolixibacteraceae bacterium Z1-6]
MVKIIFFDGAIPTVNSGIEWGTANSFEEAICKLPLGLKTAENGTLKVPRYELFSSSIALPIVFIGT